MTDQELRETMAEITNWKAETEKWEAEHKRLQAEYDRVRVEAERQRVETDRQIKQVSKQLGDLGNRFGSFTDGLAWPSLEKILQSDLHMENVSHRHKMRKNGRSFEVDVLAYDNGSRNEVYIVEVKSRLTEDGIKQILKTIADFPHFSPLLRDRKIYGIIAAVDIPQNLYTAAIKQGLYIARISDGTFELAVPRGFKPKAFGPAAEKMSSLMADRNLKRPRKKHKPEKS